MIKRAWKYETWVGVAVALLVLGAQLAWGKPVTGPGSVPDYYETPNWANSPPLRKFVDTLPGLNVAGKNNLNQYIPVAIPDTTSYPGSDYYEIEIGQYSERMHSDLPPTTLRGYRQTNTSDPTVSQFHYLGPMIVAKKDRPVRVKFTNSLPTGEAGDLFLPVDTTIMGSGEGPLPAGCSPMDPADPNSLGNCEKYTQNRALLHLHGGRTPWISDGTPHQWITPAGENTSYKKGVSASNVPDMWFDAAGVMITEATYPGSNCAGSTTCSVPGATNDPGAGSQTYYWTNQQSGRFMFYHDHSYGLTRLNVYAGEAAGYLIQDDVEQALVTGGTVNGRTFDAGTIPAEQIPLIIEDKTFVDGDSNSPTYVRKTDPTWNWGTGPLAALPNAWGVKERTPVTGDLWWPHVYMPAENPYNPDQSGMSPLGRWFYGPWFYPATPVCGENGATLPMCIAKGTVPNPYFDPTCDPAVAGFCQPPEIPGTPNVSWGGEAFMDTMTVNGTAYPTVSVEPKPYRLRILNASHDRFVNLQLYQADSSVAPGCPTCAANTEVKMVPAIADPRYPWIPSDGREGGIPDPALRGPAWIQIGTESGFLPAPVLLPNHPVSWNMDPTTFDFGNVNGGTLILGPAERGDVIVDFSQYAGKTLIVYNDAPTAFPALVPQYDYYTGAPDRTDIGGISGTPVGFGPNIRTVMQIKVAGSGGAAPPDGYDAAMLAKLQDAFKSTAGSPGVFSLDQDPVVVGQSAYNSAYGTVFPSTWPNWGISRITDTTLSFTQPDGTMINAMPMKPKAIHDEMGASFDEYGRMAAKLGLELPNSNAGNANFLLQNFIDPPTEMVTPGGIQLWKISHNGVDTHPIHFHLFDVQVVNRVTWDGIIRLPDANELGWKDTVRISPLEDTIVALRPVLPQVPFPLPDSVRPLNPAAAIGSSMGFSQTDPKTGGNLAGGMVNQLYNFGHEYVWHCHILSHEENDMMRPISLLVPPEAPTNLLALQKGSDVQLSFMDNSANETSFVIERSSDPTFSTMTEITIPSPGTTTYGTTVTAVDAAAPANAYYRVRAVDDYTPGAPASYSPEWKAAATFSAWSNIATVNVIPIAVSTPLSIDFGSRLVGTTSAPMSVLLSNSGGAPLDISAIAIGGTTPADFAILSNSCGTVVAPGSNCSVSVTFTPTAAGARGASLVITSNDPARPTLSTALTGNGVLAPVAAVAPSILNFAPTLIGTTTPAQQVTLSNSGNVPLSLTSIAITGTNPADFAATNNCGSSLAAGGSCTIGVTATPAVTGTRLAALEIRSSDTANPVLSVPLTVIGTAPVAYATPATVTFGSQFVRSSSQGAAVTLANSGNAPLVLTGLALTGANAADFTQVNNCVSPLASGGSCTIQLTFTPLAIGARNASLTITSSDPATPTLTIPVSGSGVAPVAAVAPSAIDFGSILVNTASSQQIVTVTNNSATIPLAINSVALNGTNSSEFVISNSCGAMLDPGTSCTIAASFQPLSQGTKSASITVATNDPLNGSPAGTFTVPLTGLGSSVTLSSQALQFGAQVINTTSASQVISVLNTSMSGMAISNVTVSGANAGDFTQTNNCPTTLNAGRSCSIYVRFTPTAEGARTATLSIFDSAAGSPQAVPLSGTGLRGPAGSLSPTSINFGNVRRGSTSPAQAVTFSSTGGVPIVISRIGLSGWSSGDFTLANNNCPIGGAGLAAGQSCTVSVAFKPTRRTGTRSATLVFTDNAGNVTNSTQSATLTGIAQ